MAKKNKGGRPTKLTPELIEEICKLIRIGAYIETACNFNGIHKDTYYRWAKDGARAKSGLKKEFYDSIKKAVAFAEANLIGRINEAGRQQWQAYAWIAERRFPERWANDVYMAVYI